MSEPKRYEPDHEGLMHPTPKGNYVLMQDYARLKAEVDQLKSQPDPLTVYLYAAELAKDDIKRLKAENVRLHKAGDTLMAAYCMGDHNKERWAEYPVVREWLAAKGELP